MVDNAQLQIRRPTAFRPEDSITLPDGADANGMLGHLLGESAVMHQLRLQVQQLAASSANLLISGEHGTGKRLIARTIHALAHASDTGWIVIDCADGVAAVRETLANFGFARDRFHAGSGPLTLILDRVSELSPNAQADLIQTLDGSSNGHDRQGRSTLRVIVLVGAEAERAIAEGMVHPDVIQQLAPLQLSVPPLRDREDDAELLAHYFLALLNSEEGTSKSISGDSLLLLREYSWPGNIRELRNTVQRAFVLADQELHLSAPTAKAPAGTERTLRIPVGTSLADAERWMIVATLQKCGGNKTRAAALLGVSLKTLYNRLNAYRAQGLNLSSVDRELTEVAV